MPPTKPPKQRSREQAIAQIVAARDTSLDIPLDAFLRLSKLEQQQVVSRESWKPFHHDLSVKAIEVLMRSHRRIGREVVGSLVASANDAEEMRLARVAKARKAAAADRSYLRPIVKRYAAELEAKGVPRRNLKREVSRILEARGIRISQRTIQRHLGD